MSVFKYVNNTSTNIIGSVNTVKAWDFIYSTSKLDDLGQYVNNGLDLYIDGIGQDATLEYVASNSTVALPNMAQAVPAWWKKTARTAMYLGDSILAQLAHLPHTPKGRVTRDLSPTLTNINSGASGFIILMEAGPTTSSGNGTLKFYAADSSLTWTAFGDTEGPKVTITSSACMYTLESGSLGNALYIGAIPRLKPTVDKQDTFNVTGSFTLRNNSGTMGVMGWTNALLGNPFDSVLAYAIPTIRAADWWAARAQWVNIYTDITYIMLGTNDCTSLDAAKQAVIDVENIIKLRQNIGSQVIVSGLLPWTGGTAAQKAAFVYFNNEIKDIAKRLNVDMVDPYPYMVDPLSIGNFSTGMAGDGLHPSALAGYVWAKRCNLPIFSKYTQNTMQRSFAGISYNAVTAPHGNLLLNGQLTGITGAKPSGVTGDVPTDWGVYREIGTTATAICTAPQSASPIPRTDGKPGNYLRIAVDNTTAGNIAGEGFRLRPAALITTNYAVGDYVVIEGDLRISGTGVQAIAVGVVASGNLGIALTSRETSGFGCGNLDGDVVTIPFSSYPMMLETGVTFLSVYLTVSCVAGGTAILDVGQTLTLRKVATPKN